jgi:rhodanese-related sulfurtransferase
MWRSNVTKALIPMSPASVEARVREGHALLVDIREDDEYARAHIHGSLSMPLSRFDAVRIPAMAEADVVFMCRSGMRTTANAETLVKHVGGQSFVLEGGLDQWRQAGLAVETNHKAPLEMMRQVQIVAGSLVLIGALLGALISPIFFGLSAFVGAGLVFAGATGFCGMAKLLAFLPWNRPSIA